MRRQVFIAGGVFLIVAVGGVGAASAVESGWFDTLNNLEQKHADTVSQRRQADEEIEQLDRRLYRELTDADTARRATEDLRRDVAGRLADWDRAHRTSQRMEASGQPGDARLIAQVIEHPSNIEELHWKSDVELLGEIDAGVEYSTALLVRRGRLGVESAYLAADAEKVEAQRAKVADEASEQDDEELEQERKRALKRLEQMMDLLNPLAAHDDFYREKGTLLPPVDATVDHPFGPRQREDSYTKVRHTGLTWKVDAGTQVRCTADGTVAEADRMPGFGNLVIVDHGDEHHSIYAHLDDIKVDTGDEVERGDVVGLSGDTGSVEGPKLYFELRRRGRPVDPEPWFVR